MKGCRPLSDTEFVLVLNSLENSRDKALFILGIRSGFRISELLSLRVCDVFQYGQVLDRVSVQRKHMKKKIESRSVPLHESAKKAIRILIGDHQLNPQDFLFQSRIGFNKPISRSQAWRVLNHAFEVNQLTGKLGTHSMRKSFAQRVYNALDRDLIQTQRALGHRNINSTVSYLSFDNTELDAAILKIK